MQTLYAEQSVRRMSGIARCLTHVQHRLAAPNARVVHTQKHDMLLTFQLPSTSSCSIETTFERYHREGALRHKGTGLALLHTSSSCMSEKGTILIDRTDFASGCYANDLNMCHEFTTKDVGKGSCAARVKVNSFVLKVFATSVARNHHDHGLVNARCLLSLRPPVLYIVWTVNSATYF